MSLLVIIQRVALIFFILLCSCAASAENLRIKSVKPDGEDLSSVRQIAIRFNQPVVDFPYPSTEQFASHIEISPKVECEWSFISKDTLACNLKRSLPQATAYHIAIFPSFPALDGKAIAAPVRHTFITARPKAEFASVREWKNPGKPVFLVVFNQGVLQSSLENVLYFESEDGKRYSTIARPDNSKKTEIFGAGSEHVYRNDWLVEPKITIPESQSVRLFVGPGLGSVVGPEPSVNTQLAAKVTTFSKFGLVGAKCVTTEKTTKSLLSSDKGVLCNPDMPILLTFSGPVDIDSLRNSTVIKPKIGQSLNFSSHTVLGDNGEVLYEVMVGSNWEANKVYNATLNHDRGFFLWNWIVRFIRIFKPGYGLKYVLHDSFGRTIDNKIQLEFATGDIEPRSYIPKYSVFFSDDKEKNIKLDSINIKSITYDYVTIKPNGLFKNLSLSMKLDERNRNKEISTDVPFYDILGKDDGVAIGTMSSFPRTEEHRWFIEQTPFTLRFNIHRDDALVTLFDRRSNMPVPGAKVELVEIKSTGKTLKTTPLAITGDDGSAVVPWSRQHKQYLLLAQTEKDMALLPLNNQFARKVNNSDIRGGKLLAWGVTDKPIYRPGETVKYQIYIRGHSKSAYYNLRLVDASGSAIYENNVSLSEYGDVRGEIILPNSVVRGNCEFVVSSQGERIVPMSVVTDQYFKAYSGSTTRLDSSTYFSGDRINIAIKANMLSDSEPLVKAPTSARVLLTTTPYQSHYELTKAMHFADGRVVDNKVIAYADGELGADGTTSLSHLVVAESDIYHGSLTVESMTRDLSGKYITSYAEAEFFGTDRMVGLKADSRIYAPGDIAKLEFAVVSPQDVMISDVPIKITVEYSGDNGEWSKFDKFSAYSRDHELTVLDMKVAKAGRYLVTANISDSAKRENRSAIVFYVVDGYKKPQRFIAADYSTITIDKNYIITSDKSHYSVGETARYIINNPYGASNATLSVVRDKVLEHSVRNIPAGTSILDVELTGNHAPGFYLNVDFAGKGGDNELATIKTMVNDPKNTIKLAISSDKSSYAPGENVILNIKSDRESKATLLVIDKNAFTATKQKDYQREYDIRKYFSELIANRGILSYSLFAANKPDFLIAQTPQSQVHSTAEAVYWNDNIMLDGDISITVKTPNRSADWVVIVMASDKSEGLGHAQYTYSTRNGLEMFISTPSTVVEKDKFDINLTLYNTMDQKITTDIEIDRGLDLLKKLTVDIDGGKKKNLTIHVEEVNASEKGLDLRVLESGKEAMFQHIEVIPAQQHELQTMYGLVDRYFKQGDVKAELATFNIFQPMYTKIYDAANENYKNTPRDRMPKNWHERLELINTLALMNASGFALKKNTTITYPDAQNLILSVTDFQLDNGAISTHKDLKNDQRDNFILTANTIIDFSKLKSMGYIIPSGVEKRMAEYLRSNSISDLPMIAMQAISIVDGTRSKIDTSDLSTEDRARYLSILVNTQADEAEIGATLNTLMSAPIVVSDALALNSSIHGNCAALDALNSLGKLVDTYTISQLARYVYHMIDSEKIRCLVTLYNYSLKNEVDIRKNVRLSINNKEIINKEIIDDIATISKPNDNSLAYQLEVNGRGLVPYSIELARPILQSNNHGIEVSKRFSRLIDGEYVVLEPPFAVKVGDIVKTEIIVSTPVPLRNLEIQETVPGGLEMLSQYTNNKYVPREIAVDISSMPYNIDFKGRIRTKLDYANPDYTYNMYYFSYAKTPGKFGAPFAKVSVLGLSDIFGYSKSGESLTIEST